MGKKVAVALALICLAAFIVITVKKADDKRKNTDLTYVDSIIKEEWKYRRIGASGLHVVAPVAIKETHFPIPESEEKITVKRDTYAYIYNNFKMYMGVSIKKGEIDQYRIAENFAANLENQPGVTKYNYLIKQAGISGKKGYYSQSNATINDTEYVIDTLTLYEGQYVWRVVVYHDRLSDKLSILTRKVLESVKVVKPEELEKEQSKVLDSSKWKMRPIGETHVNLFAPDELRKVVQKLDENAKKELEHNDLYMYRNGKFAITVLHFEAVEKPFDAEIYAANILNRLKGIEKFSSLSASKGMVNVGDKTGVKVEASAMDGTTKMRFDSVTIAKDKKLFHIAVHYEADNDSQKALAEKILTTAEIK